THIVPAGEYARVTDDSGAEILQDGTYSQISSSPASFFDFMFAVPDGLIDTADIVIGIIIIGGMFAVIEKAGLIELAVSRLANVFEDKAVDHPHSHGAVRTIHCFHRSDRAGSR